MTSLFSHFKSQFKVEQVPDLTGKVALVTGGNTGLGYETVLRLAQKGARVFMASRSPVRAEEALAKLRAAEGEDVAARVEFLQLDLQDLRQVQSAARTFLDKKLPLHILVNNAGIMAPPFALTKDGIETQLGTNHVGHFALTLALIPALQQATPARVVNLSSYGHNFAPKEGIVFNKINDESLGSSWVRYGQAKLANILFTRGLHKRFGEQGLLANAVHPGVVLTELTRGPRELYGVESGWKAMFAPLMSLLEYSMSLNVQQGALTQVYVATAPEIEEKKIGGKYFVPFAHQYEGPGLSQQALDDILADKLWEWTEKIVKEKTEA